MKSFKNQSLHYRLACLFATACMSQTVLAQGVIVDLLPAGVTINVNPERKQDKAKNIVVAGSPEKGYKAFFAATDPEHGEELWVTDGTPEGTRMVKDIVPGTGTSNPSYLGRLNDKVLFSAYTDEGGSEPWVSDGTEEGTYQLVDAYIYGDGDPKAFLQMNEKQAIFVCIDDESAEWIPGGTPQHWLWVTDGTVEGTHRVVSADGSSEHQANCIFPGKDNTTLHTAYCRVGRRVFFKADNTDGMIGEEVWVTDGTEEGTYLVMDINWEKGQQEGQTLSAGIDNFENYKNERLFFQAWTPSYGGEPWTTDGVKGEPNTQEREVASGYTESGDEHTFMIKDTHEGRAENGIGFHAGTFGTGWEVYKDRIWYRGWDPVGGYEFSGTNMQKGDYKFYDINKKEPSVNNNSFSDPGCIFDGVYMFCAATGFDASLENNYGGELHYFDGEAVHLQSNLVPGTNSNWVKEQTVAGGSMYWMNETNGEWDQGFGTGLYRLDSKDQMPVVCERIDPSASSSGDMVHTLRNLGGTIIYAAGVNNRIYCYKYTKDGWDGVSDMGYLEPDFMTEAEKTAIQNISNDIPSNDGKIYNAAGQRIESLQKGVNIVNGKKVVIR